MSLPPAGAHPMAWPNARWSKWPRAPTWPALGMISWTSTPARSLTARPASRPWAGSCSTCCSTWPVAARRPGPSGGSCTTRWGCSTRRRSPDAISQSFANVHRFLTQPNGHRFRTEAGGVPGQVHLQLHLQLSADNALHMAWSAHALDAPTVVNITGHAFCNLAGAGSNHGHFLQLPASRYLPLAADICRQRRAGQCARDAVGLAATPPGGRRSGPALRSMAHGRRAGPLPGARRNRTVGALICRSAGPARLARSARPPGLRLAALLIKPISGRSMQLWSTAPGVQVYAGHGLKADPARDRGRGAEAEGWLWQPGDGICLEPMESPDKSALGKTAIDQNSETDGHAD